MEPSLSRLITSLELAWASFTHRPDAVAAEYGGFLRMLLAAPAEQATAAVIESRWLRDRLRHWDWAMVSTPDEMARLRHLMAQVLASYLSASGTSEDVAPFIDSLRPFSSPELVPLLAQCMRRRTLRTVTSHVLAHQNTPAAWTALRENDGTDLDADLRMAITVHDPAQSHEALVALLGPEAERTARSRALMQAMSRVDPQARPDLVELIMACLDEGFDAHYVLNMMARKNDPALRRRLFDILWPVAQTQPLRLPWPDLSVFAFYDALVRSSPAVELIATLLDTIEDQDSAEALCPVLAQYPDPIFVPALTRWSRTFKKKKTTFQRLVTRVVDACNRVAST